jgi:hypothetical protein
MPGPLAKTYQRIKKRCFAHVVLNGGAADFVGKLIDIPKPLTMIGVLSLLILKRGGLGDYVIL